MSNRSLDNTPSSLSPIKIRIRPKLNLSKIQQLSRPRPRGEDEEQVVGPGTYNPTEVFLSTKSKSPSAAIGRSERFLNSKLLEIRKSVKLHQDDDARIGKFADYTTANSPHFTFKRTGHNLKLVNNPENPGVGRYSPVGPAGNSSYIFAKAVKEFSWKKGNF